MLKDGVLIKKVNYKQSFSCEVSESGIYTVKVTVNNKISVTKDVQVSLNLVDVDVVSNVIGDKAEIVVYATTSAENSITMIEVSGNGVLESIENQDTFRIEVTENGVYQIKVTDSEGNITTKDITISGI